MMENTTHIGLVLMCCAATLQGGDENRSNKPIEGDGYGTRRASLRNGPGSRRVPQQFDLVLIEKHPSGYELPVG
jgi:hypothetical protein